MARDLLFSSSVMTNSELSQSVMERIEALAQISEESGRLTRTFGSPAMRQANDLVAGWMKAAGMSVSEDAIGNLIARYPAASEHAKTFILGSHLDTVRGAGKFDGSLGVLVALACVEQLHAEKKRLPFGIDLVAFAEGEGLRFNCANLGSRALAGSFDEQNLQLRDANGVTMADAIKSIGGDPGKISAARRDPQEILGYAEVHIEQGPVLEKKFQPVGIVTAIAGRTRAQVKFTGQCGHAGTTPMPFRRDALAAAAEFILAVEGCTKHYPGLVATVCQIEARPSGASLIPCEVTLSLDVRHQVDGARAVAGEHLQETAAEIAMKRGVEFDWENQQELQSIPCSRELSDVLAKAARAHIVSATELPSGAGHDAAAMSQITPSAMLFVRCRGGISHHPDESVQPGDVEIAVGIMNDFLRLLANQQNPMLKKRS